MSNGEQARRVEIPAAAAKIIDEYNRRLLVAQNALNSNMALLRAALGVPEDWVIRDLREGFIDPASTQDGGE